MQCKALSKIFDRDFLRNLIMAKSFGKNIFIIIFDRVLNTPLNMFHGARTNVVSCFLNFNS